MSDDTSANQGNQTDSPTGNSQAGQPMERQRPPVEPLLQFFAYQHLPERLQPVSAPFHDLALALVMELPRNPERTVCLRKLLEAKDCAVRAVLFEG